MDSFPKDKKAFFTEKYDALETNINKFHNLMLHDQLSFRNNRPCYICGKYEDNVDHLLFQCPFLARVQNLVKGWLEMQL